MVMATRLAARSAMAMAWALLSPWLYTEGDFYFYTNL